MSITVLPGGKRVRAQVYNARTGKTDSVAKILNLPRGKGTWPNTRQGKREAMLAREQARQILAGETASVVTVAAWFGIWSTAKEWQRPKQSTNMQNQQNVGWFVDKYGHLALSDIGLPHAREAIQTKPYAIPSLRVMFNDARKPAAGQLITSNPFERLGVSKGKGNTDVQPPTADQVAKMFDAASRVATPMFRAWLIVACYTGMRPGELDALKWANVDFDKGRIHVVEQFSGTSKTFTLPKNGRRRTILLTPQAREALKQIKPVSDFCFVNTRRQHFTPSSRAFSWKAVHAGARLEADKTLYLCTRHWAGSYMVNTLQMPSEDVAIQLGHTDGGELVRTLYGHRDHGLALDRLEAAYAHQLHTSTTGDANIRLEDAA